jgi:transcriptional regulator GlxA family with amidase domain
LGTDTLVISKQLITAGAASSSYLVAVRGLEKIVGRQMADKVGRFLLLRMGSTPQASFAIPPALLGNPIVGSPVTKKLQERLMDGVGSKSVGTLAARAGLSTRQLLRRVRAETGMSVRDWIHHNRVERLRGLLAHSDRKWEDLSDSVGYADPFHAIRRFKRATGLTPAQFRIIHRA